MMVLYVVVVLAGLHVLAAAQNQQNGTNSTGLRCYACAGTGRDNVCKDYDTYKDAMDGKGNEYIKKDCTPPYNATCFIETFSALGATVSHIRGCSDGRHFSFSYVHQENRDGSTYRRLETLPANNQTACVWNGKQQVCLTKCNTNFCNGPQLEEISGAIWNNISTSVLIFLIMSHMFQRQF